MKKELTITLTNDDRDCLLNAANIMETLSNRGRCWTASDIRELVNKNIEKKCS